MTPWPKKPFVYELNTWLWLDSLSRIHNRPITLENIPDSVLDELSSYHVDAIWLMGIWHHSPAGRNSALKYADQYKYALSDLVSNDIVGSPYAVGSYQPDEHFGGRHGLATFRENLRARGMKLLLDFVPNHVATDHAWVRVHPDYMVMGTPKDLERRPDDFFATQDITGKHIVVAHGKDPYFPGWIDTAQVNAYSPGLRKASLQTLLDIASQCDGVRCDMAMLMLNEVFGHTWRGCVDKAPKTEYWADIIPHVKAQYPDFLFMAEVYWDMEARLQTLGFDYCYDKRLYDRLRDNKIAEVRTHMIAAIGFQNRLVRFIENHDEHRAAESFGIDRQYPAAVVACTLPGATLLHEGQFIGRRIKLPVQIGRQPQERPNADLKSFYLKLLAETRANIYHEGEWMGFNVAAGKENGTHNNLLSYGWRQGNDYRLIVVNLSDAQSQGHVQLGGWPEVGGCNWILNDVLSGDHYPRQGNGMTGLGLYVDLRPYQSHLFSFTEVR